MSTMEMNRGNTSGGDAVMHDGRGCQPQSPDGMERAKGDPMRRSAVFDGRRPVPAGERPTLAPCQAIHGPVPGLFGAPLATAWEMWVAWNGDRTWSEELYAAIEAGRESTSPPCDHCDLLCDQRTGRHCYDFGFCERGSIMCGSCTDECSHCRDSGNQGAGWTHFRPCPCPAHPNGCHRIRIDDAGKRVALPVSPRLCGLASPPSSPHCRNCILSAVMPYGDDPEDDEDEGSDE